MAFDAKNVSTNDWGVIGAAAGVFLFSLIGSYISVSVDVGGELDGLGVADMDGGVTNAWDSYATLGLLLLLAVGALAAARVFAGVQLPHLPVGWNLIAAAAAGLGALLVILRAFTVGDDNVFGAIASYGPGWSGYVLMLLAIAETIFAVLAFRTSGEQLAWQQSGGGTGSAPSAGTTPTWSQPGGGATAPPSSSGTTTPPPPSSTGPTPPPPSSTGTPPPPPPA